MHSKVCQVSKAAKNNKFQSRGYQSIAHSKAKQIQLNEQLFPIANPISKPVAKPMIC